MALFRKQTVDGIMAAFEDTISNLETLNTNAQKDVEALTAQRDTINTQIAEAETEGSRALKIAASLRKLTNGDI
ncbi:hypothetical protein HYO99_gp46 [Roseobacter phage RD-1410W1-01]|uniref:Uncharacterized protein n=1 Tax=Roseobacter phage RD-1410W1-01 TaxID=1815984 RepID=A0A191VYJ3_9CAUD|nr:hypothetical protein HYO99_gp46 [Roseobacter phage RD-1410W1-01]ANJ20780.1 hypothetical protein RDp01_gp46 [Roseobacter phage RD-1410W1-01]